MGVDEGEELRMMRWLKERGGWGGGGPVNIEGPLDCRDEVGDRRQILVLAGAEG